MSKVPDFWINVEDFHVSLNPIILFLCIGCIFRWFLELHNLIIFIPIQVTKLNMGF